MPPVRNFLRKQTDVDHHNTSTAVASKSPELERPLSEYDNLTTLTTQTHFDIKFRFDDSPLNMNSLEEASSCNNNNSNNNNTSLPQSSKPRYENVPNTAQIRESDQQVKINQNDEHSPSNHRSVISDAKSTFFGLTHPIHHQPNNDDFNELLDDDDKRDGAIINSQNQYVNVMPNDLEEELCKSPSNINHDKVSATSSASGSSSTTATPSASPTRHDRTDNSRKNSEGSNRSKSPKITLPEASPSQTVYMSTTVPQNIKGPNFGTRHKPTRNSLRHSRMIVTNKHSQGNSCNYLNIRHVWLAKFVLILKTITGFSLLALGGWICLFANSTPISQNPFWSGLILIISGLLGLYLLSFGRIHRKAKLKAKFFWFLKMNASMIIIMTVFLTTLAFIYASFHFISIASDNKKCFPENIFINSSSCICVFNVKPEAMIMVSRGNGTDAQGHLDSSGQIDIPDGSNIVHFRDLSCNELDTWSHILLTSMILNLVGLVVSVIYMTQFIFGCKRRKKRTYASVRSAA